MRSNTIISIFLFFYCIFPHSSFSKEAWVLDDELSTISFEIPVFLANNVRGRFTKIEGLVEIDLDTQENNKAIISVGVNSVEMNYKKYRNLLLSNIFFNAKQFPISLVDTKKFSYENESELEILAELSIKGITGVVPLQLEIIRLAEGLVQIKGKLKFSRTAFQIGVGKWSSTAILKDAATIETDLFFFRE